MPLRCLVVILVFLLLLLALVLTSCKVMAKHLLLQLIQLLFIMMVI